ncbi:sigma-70 family RNA polymerase sigma factor [Tistrella mobilis]|uniref:sigma-70 family RNA polymerase sigma factor n=1 Tax=Tistrella mobilis TaxID=171437 RepID=UPI003557BC32
MDHGPETDRLHDLLTAVGTGDRRAFDTLYLRLSGRLHAVALRMLRDADLAEDAVHDAFVQIWRNAGRYDRARGEVTAWTIGILRYRALDLLRRRGRETAADPVIVADLADQAAAADPDNPPAFTPPELPGRLNRLDTCMAALSDGARGSIRLAYVDGLSHGEIAGRTGQPLGTVKSWIRRGLAALKECLEQ